MNLSYHKDAWGFGKVKNFDHVAHLGPFKIIVRDYMDSTTRGQRRIVGWLYNDGRCVTPENFGQAFPSVKNAKQYYKARLAEEINKYKAIKPYL